MAARSIRRHVLGWLFAAAALGALLLTVATYVGVRREQNELLDAALREVALAAAGRDAASVRPSHPLADDERIVIGRWAADGSRSYLSDPQVPIAAPAREGLARQRIGGHDWDVYAVPLADGAGHVAAAQRADAQDARAVEAASQLQLPLLAVIALEAVLLVVALRRGLAPLDAATRQLSAHGSDAPVHLDEADLPRELRSLARAMNQLMDRLGLSLEVQRRFVADAAHELRTPVAALRLQQQLAAEAPDEVSRRRAVADLAAGIERVQRLVEQLLDLSRLDPGGAVPAPPQAVALDTLAGEVVADLAWKADRAGVDLGLSRADAAVVQGDAPALRTLVANLVDNALRHTPRGGVVDVAVQDGPDGVVLDVDDSGPGIAPAERERVFERFYRGAGEQADGASPGSGLGLSIVQVVAERHGARVTLHDSPRGGLRARVRFAPGPSGSAAASSAARAPGAPA